jgi:Fe-S-cluster containining protein
MILSENDVEKILRNISSVGGFSDFAEKKEKGMLQLRNIDDHCIFFDPTCKSCKIYDFRPKGCRFYPLVYDLNAKKCFLDDDCPRRNLLYQDRLELKDICTKMRTFLRKELHLKL